MEEKKSATASLRSQWAAIMTQSFQSNLVEYMNPVFTGKYLGKDQMGLYQGGRLIVACNINSN